MTKMFGRRDKASDGTVSSDRQAVAGGGIPPELDVEITDELALNFSDLEITDEFARPLMVAGDDTEPGPHDFDDVAEYFTPLPERWIDLGSVILPVLAGSDLQVEMSPDGAPQAVHLSIAGGRITVAAYAAPKSPGQWREVAADLAESLRREDASVSVVTGPWGRELVAATGDTEMRFIGADGYRWMVRLVAVGPLGSVAANGPLVAAAHDVLRNTVVRRDAEPHPVRTPLPVVLPQDLAQQLAAAHRRQLEEQAEERVAAVLHPPLPGIAVGPDVKHQPRRGVQGSAMQQLRR